MNLQFQDEWAGHYSDGEDSDKIWAATYATSGGNGVYLAVWGKRMGAKGSWKRYQSLQHPSGAYEAGQEFRDKVAEKQGKGYQTVSFNDPRHGSIPSFVTGLASPSASTPDESQITAPGLLRQIESLRSRLQRRANQDMAMLLMEFQQIKVKVEVFAEFGKAPSSELLQVAAATTALQGVLSAILVG